MAHRTITRACGHLDSVTLWGKQEAREERAEYEAGRLCRSCWLAKRETEKAEEQKAALQAAREQGLRPLDGTDKQVAWAETLRHQVLSEEAALRERAQASPRAQEAVNLLEDTLRILRDEGTARFWIDNRKVDLYSHVQRVFRIRKTLA